ncbi:MAG: Asp-tRNA(Asn)/Glu-tRNA(Gln) amidotransferase subunit GatC [Deltaproteobacteria bacterium]|nr:MAG: Asp-tRNA(Asn)/Glu-tRNA(Gln) amidotransferase subunit GatC [Deltaproteobacteria bacterium]
MAITREEVLHIARLARLALTEDEVSLFTEQLGKILDYMAKLNELDVADVEPTAHAIEMTNVLREDVVTNGDQREEILSNAPDRSGDCFRVPRILED